MVYGVQSLPIGACTLQRNRCDAMLSEPQNYGLQIFIVHAKFPYIFSVLTYGNEVWATAYINSCCLWIDNFHRNTFFHNLSLN